MDQLGGMPGCSVSHYLINMIHFILSKLDPKKSPSSIIAAFVDFSKAFNRMSHNRLVIILSDLEIPTCALRLILSYLKNRKMCVRYKGAVSENQSIPGGGPQGSLLTVLCFILQVNDAGKPCLDEQPSSEPSVPKPCQLNDMINKKKYVDDLSMLEVVKLEKLVPIEPFIGPLNYYERHGFHLPPSESILQHQLDDLLKFTQLNQMLINKKKTFVMPFNFYKTKNFIPKINFPGDEP